VNFYNGTTAINGGTLRVSGGSAINDASPISMANVSGVMFDLNNTDECVASISGGGTIGGTIALGSGTLSTIATSGTLTFSGVISGAGGITKSGAGVQVLAGTNTYTGPTIINGGTLRVAGGNAIANTGAVILTNIVNSTFDLAGSTETVGSISGGSAANGRITLNAGKLICGGNNASTQFDGFISGTGGGEFEKIGTGTLTLTNVTASNNYPGPTTISSGVLTINGTQSASAIQLNGGTLYGTGTCGAISVNPASSNSAIHPGTPANQGTLTTAAVNLSQGTTPTVRIRISGYTGAITNDRLVCAGALTLGGTSQLVIDLAGLTSDVAALPIVTCGNLAGSVNFNSIIFENAGTATASAAWNGGFTSLNVTVTGPGLPGNAYTSTGSGDWDDAIWSPVAPTGGPSSADTVIIVSNHQITLDGNRSIKNVVFSGSGSIIGTSSLTMGGNVVVLGSRSPAISCNNLAFGTVLANVTNNGTGTLTISSQITGTAGFLKQGTGAVVLSGTNNYTGITSIMAGMLMISGGNAIDDNSPVVLADVASAVLSLDGSGEEVGSITGGGATGGNIALGSGTLTCGRAGSGI
jgi:fibronectin-binding autotransporter adhesin